MLVTLPRGVANPLVAAGKAGLSGNGFAGFGVSELLRRPTVDAVALADDRRRGVAGESTLVQKSSASLSKLKKQRHSFRHRVTKKNTPDN